MLIKYYRKKMILIQGKQNTLLEPETFWKFGLKQQRLCLLLFLQDKI